MENKKILVAYYSKSGNTERVAKDLASRLGADLEKIIDQKDRSGILGFIFSGRDAMKKYQTKIDQPKFDPADYGLLAIGTPVWGGGMVPAVRTYLGLEKSKIKKLVCFETSGDTPPERMAESVEEITEIKPLAFTGFKAKELKDKEAYQKKMDSFTDIVKGIS